MALELTDDVADKLDQLGPPSAEFKMDLELSGRKVTVDGRGDGR
jgi:hypothetical protein